MFDPNLDAAMTGPTLTISAPTPENAFRTSLLIPLEKNPLSLNGRDHFLTKARHTKQWREFVRDAATEQRWPELGRCMVTLTWYVNTRHRRDEDNLVPLFKAMCDGLVDAGVVLDDTSEFMVKLMPRIKYRPDEVQCMWLDVTQLTGEEAS